jgi:SPP1 gp7 family putative phage head morphogenesis protein
LVDRFKLEVIKVHANLDVGGYAWLRKGFFPAGENAVEALKKIYWAPEFIQRISGMSNDEVRAFVLSDEFRKYKSAFVGTHWYGSADMTDERARAALFGQSRAKLPTQIADATYHSVMLERLKAAEVRDFNAMVPLLEKQVNELLERLRGTTLSEMTRGQINAQLRLLRTAQQAVLTEATDKLERRLRMLAEYEAGFEAATLQRYLTEAGTGTVLTVPTGPAAFALANAVPLSATGDLLLPWVSKMTAEEVDQINKMILRGYSEGWTNDQLATMLRGTKALNYTDGLLPRMGKHNATIVRTAIQHVASTAREQVWRDNEDVIDRYRWVATLDSRTSPTCRTLDGQEFELGKGPRPPIHPNCRSTTVAVIAGLEGLLDNLQRASVNGQVPASMTYYEWLKTQSAAFQEEVLGPSRYKMFARSDMTADKFAKLQLNSAFQPLTLEEIRKRDRR